MTAGKVQAKSRMQAVLELGQSIWLDYLRRGMTRSGELQDLIDRGLRGMTSNPTIFEQAIGSSTDYDEALSSFRPSQTDMEVFEALAVEDVREAADLFRPLYDATDAMDGFVSLEVSPLLARDTEATIAEARRLWATVDRPNVMIKVPGTREGWPAIERLLADGINVNVTLLFSLDHYAQVLEAYFRALETRVKAGRPVDRVASVASFFVSRVDTEVDRRLQERGAPANLAGRAAVANAHLAYARFQEASRGARWKGLQRRGARPQRLLWASTGTKNPKYHDVMYVDGLLGSQTINTLPPATLAHFEDHGLVQRTLPSVGFEARKTLSAVSSAGVDLADVSRVLEDEGVAKFAQSFEGLLRVIGKKREALGVKRTPRASAQLRAFDTTVAHRVDLLDQAHIPRRIWARDPSVWTRDPGAAEITNRLGWLTVCDFMVGEASGLAAFAEEVRRRYDRVVLCGMGGSSLAPEVLWRAFGRRRGFPSLALLDSTDPRTIARIDKAGDPRRTLFIIASKSGTTQESDSFFRYFWERTGRRGEQFVAITDPGTPLVDLANANRFRKGFANPPDIGGRYSALSYFGLVPAALVGIDVARLVERAQQMVEACGPFTPAYRNPAVSLGAMIGEGALAGRDKLTFVLSGALTSFGLWAEQLLAESTGKDGKGVLPVAGDSLAGPEAYGSDRVFVSMALASEVDSATEERLEVLARAGHPVVRLVLEDVYDIGQEFFRWEFATAVAGAVLGIHPFDQPNVAESKANTQAVLREKIPPIRAATSEELTAFLGAPVAGDYVAILAYLPPGAETDARLEAIRTRLRDRLKVAVTVGYGPRYLHSTGQLHKGGSQSGHFLQVVSRAGKDVAIPGVGFTFGMLEDAQAEGDLLALRKRGRPAIRVEGLDALEGAI